MDKVEIIIFEASRFALHMTVALSLSTNATRRGNWGQPAEESSKLPQACQMSPLRDIRLRIFDAKTFTGFMC
jgi:hypothetical protein